MSRGRVEKASDAEVAYQAKQEADPVVRAAVPAGQAMHELLPD